MGALSLGLRGRIVALTAVALAAGLGAVTTANAWWFHRQYRVALESRALAVATGLSVQLERLLHLGIGLDSLIGFDAQCREAVQAYRGIHDAEVVAPDGRVLFHGDPSSEGAVLEPELRPALGAPGPVVLPFTDADGPSFAAVVPVRVAGGEPLAHVVVEVPAAEVTGPALRMALATGGFGLVLVALALIGLVVVLDRGVTRPLGHLVAALQAMRQEGPEATRRVAVPREPELGRLAEAFNGLMDDLARGTVSRSRLEEANRILAEQEAQYRLLVETTPTAILVACDGRLVFVNPAGVALLGAADGAALAGRPVLDVVHPEARPALDEQVRGILAGARSFQLRDVRLVRLDGAVREVEVTGIALGYAGRPAVQLVVHDVTERKHLHAQLIATGRLAALGTLARGVAHEINNPLTYVVSGLQFLTDELDDLGKELPPGRVTEAQEAVSDARRGASQVRLIVNDLQAFARDRDRVEPVALARVLDMAANIAAGQLRNRARVVKDYGPVAPVMGNEARLTQVFLNLIVNAALAVGEGHPEEHAIALVTRQVGALAVVEVRDDGCGIPRAVQERLFEPFFTTRAVGEGTGLGLFVSLGLVRAMKGDLAVTSEPGHGTTARVTLPVAG